MPSPSMPRGLQERMANRNTGIHNWVQFTTIFKEKNIHEREYHYGEYVPASDCQDIDIY